MSVAESTVILAPIRHVGWARASSTPTAASEAASRPRKGPPEAVRIAAWTRSGARPARSWKSAECSESTGTSAAPVRARAAATRSPPTTRLSLLASATGMPRSSAASVGRSPAAPSSPFSTRSGSLRSMRAASSASKGTEPPPTAAAVWAMPCSSAWASISATRAPQDSPHATRSSALSTTSSACRPIEPVEPRTRIRFTAAECSALGRGPLTAGQEPATSPTKRSTSARTRSSPARQKAASPRSIPTRAASVRASAMPVDARSASYSAPKPSGSSRWPA